MVTNNKFWISLAVFEIIFGFAVFAVTRQYYTGNAAPVGGNPIGLSEAISTRPDNITASDLARFNLLVPNQETADDPVEISRQANDSFNNGQYDRAAELYEKLLTYGPDNVDTYNNLGITLHYLGRSTEALQILKEGVAIDSAHQRIWLTLGFVYSQTGNFDEARAALTNALQVGPDEKIIMSATDMLEKLP